MDSQLKEGLRSDLMREIATIGRFALQSSVVGQGPLKDTLADLAWDALRRATDLARLIEPDEEPGREPAGAADGDTEADGRERSLPSAGNAPDGCGGQRTEGEAVSAFSMEGDASDPFAMLAANLQAAGLGAFAYRERLLLANRSDEPLVAAALATLILGVEEERNRLGRLLRVAPGGVVAGAGRPAVPV